MVVVGGVGGWKLRERLQRERESMVFREWETQKSDMIEREISQINEKREKVHCIHVSARFIEFLFGLNASLHLNSELDVLIVDLERF